MNDEWKYSETVAPEQWAEIDAGTDALMAGLSTRAEQARQEGLAI